MLNILHLFVREKWLLFDFRSGSIIITGANNIYELKIAYFHCDILKKHVDDLFYYDIGEDIKVKKERCAKRRLSEAH